MNTNIAIVTCYTPAIKELVAPLSANKQEYCDRWGYKFFLEIEDWDEVAKCKSGGFYKIDYLLRLMMEHPEIEVFVWMDNDAFVMDQTLPLENFNSDADLMIGEDWNGINVGVFFIKNNPKCLDFLEKVYNYQPTQFESRPYWWARSEQCAISNLMDSSDITVDLHHHWLFNGYITEPRPDNDWRRLGLCPRNPNWKPKQFQMGDFILHFAGIHNHEKPQLIEEYIQKVIK